MTPALRWAVMTMGSDDEPESKFLYIETIKLYCIISLHRDNKVVLYCIV